MPADPVEASQPLQPLGMGRHILTLVRVGPGHDETAQFFLTKKYTQVGKPGGVRVLGGIGSHAGKLGVKTAARKTSSPQPAAPCRATSWCDDRHNSHAKISSLRCNKSHTPEIKRS